jgi:hypothetical protein
MEVVNALKHLFTANNSVTMRSITQVPLLTWRSSMLDTLREFGR